MTEPATIAASAPTIRPRRRTRSLARPPRMTAAADTNESRMNRFSSSGRARSASCELGRPGERTRGTRPTAKRESAPAIRMPRCLGSSMTSRTKSGTVPRHRIDGTRGDRSAIEPRREQPISITIHPRRVMTPCRASSTRSRIRPAARRCRCRSHEPAAARPDPDRGGPRDRRRPHADRVRDRVPRSDAGGRTRRPTRARAPAACSSARCSASWHSCSRSRWAWRPTGSTPGAVSSWRRRTRSGRPTCGPATSRRRSASRSGSCSMSTRAPDRHERPGAARREHRALGGDQRRALGDRRGARPNHREHGPPGHLRRVRQRDHRAASRRA